MLRLASLVFKMGCRMMGRLGLVFIIFAIGVSVGFAAETYEACMVPMSQKICYVVDETQRKCIDKPEELAGYNIEQEIDQIYAIAPVLMKAAMCRIDQVKIAQNIYENGEGFVRPLEKKRIIYTSWEAIIATHLPYWEYSSSNSIAYKYGVISSTFGQNYYLLDDYKSLKYELIYLEKYNDQVNHGLARLIFHELAHYIEVIEEFNQFAPLDILGCFKKHQAFNKSEYQSRLGIIKGYDAIFSEQFEAGLDSGLVSELFHSEYPTFYGLTNLNEDFAELMAEYIMLTYLGINYQVSKGEKLLFDRAAQFRHENIQPKLRVIKSLLALHEMSDNARKEFAQDQLHCRGNFEVNK